MENALGKMLMFLNRESKLNKVALSPDSWLSNGVLGNIFMLMQTRDLMSYQGWLNLIEAKRTLGSTQARAVNLSTASAPSFGANPSYDSAQMQEVIAKINELISALRKQAQFAACSAEAQSPPPLQRYCSGAPAGKIPAGATWLERSFSGPVLGASAARKTAIWMSPSRPCGLVSNKAASPLTALNSNGPCAP